MPIISRASQVASHLPQLLKLHQKILKMPSSAEPLRMIARGIRVAGDNGTPRMTLFGRKIRIPGKKIIHSFRNTFFHKYQTQCITAFDMLARTLTTMPLIGPRAQALKNICFHSGVKLETTAHNGKEYLCGITGEKLPIDTAKALIRHHAEYMASPNREPTYHEMKTAEEKTEEDEYETTENSSLPAKRFGVLSSSLDKTFGPFRPVSGVEERVAYEDSTSEDQVSEDYELDEYFELDEDFELDYNINN